MSLNGTITFQSIQMDLSYKEQVAREKEALSLRTPTIKGLSPSIEYIEVCMPLRSSTMIMEDARRDAPKFREEAERKTELDEKRAAIERVSQFLGPPKNKSKSRGR